MPRVQNRENRFKLLYLPKRVVRFKSKEIKELYQYEIESEEFKKRADEFRVETEEPDEPEEEVQEQEETEEGTGVVFGEEN